MESKRKRNEDGYRDTESKDGTISSTIERETAMRVKLICKHRNISKTKYINQAVKEKLERDIQGDKIEISMEEWFDYMIAKEQTTDKYEQMGIPGIE